MKKVLAEIVPGAAELLLPPLCFLLGSQLGEQPVDWTAFGLYSLVFVIPAGAAAVSCTIMADRPVWERFLPFGAGLLWSLASQSFIGATGMWSGDLFVRLFIPVLASGIILFLMGLLRLCSNIRRAVQQFRDMMAGKLPLIDQNEEK